MTLLEIYAHSSFILPRNDDATQQDLDGMGLGVLFFRLKRLVFPEAAECFSRSD